MNQKLVFMAQLRAAGMTLQRYAELRTAAPEITAADWDRFYAGEMPAPRRTPIALSVLLAYNPPRRMWTPR